MAKFLLARKALALSITVAASALAVACSLLPDGGSEPPSGSPARVYSGKVTDDGASAPPEETTDEPGLGGAKHDETVVAVDDDPDVADAGNAPLPPPPPPPPSDVDASTGGGDDAGVEPPPPPPPPPGPPPVVLYMNRGGAVVKPGTNNSARNTSQVVTAETRFPASTFAGSDAEWGAFLDAVRAHFARYNVAVIDVEPTSGNYIEAIITSGSPSLIGRPNQVWGIAPSRCGIVAAAIAFVFDHGTKDPVNLGEIAAHELGHTLSLSHTQTASDLMAYSNVSPKKFEDRAALCGPNPGVSESCNCEGTTQNNHAQLLRFVGASPE